MEQVDAVQDIMSLSQSDRWRLYRTWRRKHEAVLTGRKEQQLKMSESCYAKYKELKAQEDSEVMREATVIGMTTTGAARYQKVLGDLRPTIVIIEEAAEVLEGHIVTSLSQHCQHLILIGDHLQLRPNPTVYELARNYNLNLSLFERMINNQVEFACLGLQHRMRPQISRLMRLIYPNLKDHPVVKNYPNVKGTGSSVVFLDHKEKETVDVDKEQRSHSNKHEAEFLAELCRYFLLQGYEPSQLTILTLYSRQLLEFKKQMPKEQFEGVRITTVDNYQGEENDVVMLSLVRSNDNDKIGFVGIENRICVALSRAKHGLFVLGNFDLMAKKSKLWNRVVMAAKSEGIVSDTLHLACQNHPEDEGIDAQTAKDFKSAPEGGCMKPCEYRLPCGHVCPKVSHPSDLEHKFVLCNEPCEKVLACDHTCKGTCSQCQQGRLHVDCMEKCTRSLICEHKCTSIACSSCPPCTKKCKNRCPHSKCALKCGELCKPCVEPCAWECPHLKCNKLCSEICDRQPCNEPCDKVLKGCGHKCIGLCGEVCPKACRVCNKEEVEEIFFGDEDKEDAKFVQLLDCKHYFEVGGLDTWMQTSEEGQNAITLKMCPKCKTPIANSTRYGNAIKKVTQDVNSVKTQSLGNAKRVKDYVGKLKALVKALEKKDAQRAKPRKPKVGRGGARGGRRLGLGLVGQDEADEDKEDDVIIFPPEFPWMENVSFKVEKRVQKMAMNLLHPFKGGKNGRRVDTVKTEENLVSFFNQMEALKLLTNWRTSRCFGSEMLPLDYGNLKVNVDGLEKWLLVERQSFSDQNSSDFNEEMWRVKMWHNFLEGLLTGHHAAVDAQPALELLRKGVPINEKDKAFIEEIWKKVNKGLGITDKERLEIVKAMNFNKGHWYKCPNGHVYAIGDCGGAMVESKCPECE